MFAGQSNSPGPNDNVYNGHNGSAADTGYVNANSPQPNPFQAIPINRVSRYASTIIDHHKKSLKTWLLEIYINSTL